MSGGIVQYQASDGSSVKLTPGVVMKYIISGNTQASDKDVYAFMAKCQARRLNPLAGDAYMTTYRNKDGSTTSTVIVSKDYFVRTATQQPAFDGMRAGVAVLREDGEVLYREGSLVLPTEQLVGGWSEVYDKGRSHPSRAEVSLKEYDTGRSMWRSKPATMIRKVALVQALREAYPGAYGGIYDSDELDVPEPAAPVDVPAQVVEDAPAPAADAQVTAAQGDEAAEVYAEDVEW